MNIGMKEIKAMSEMSRTELENKFHGIVEHYNHACEKHPFFADTICVEIVNWKKDADDCKWLIQLKAKNKQQVTAHSVLMAELYEIFAAFCSGNYEQARYEVLDTIAVLLRMDDMIRDFQEKKEEKPND